MLRWDAASLARREALDAVRFGTARVAVAVERYRHEHGDQLPGRLSDCSACLQPMPIDPYSGQPFKYAQRGSGYVVYSVGTNRQDDGGRLVDVYPPNTAKDEAAPDLGILIEHQAPSAKH
jgi:hypothetical protein